MLRRVMPEPAQDMMISTVDSSPDMPLCVYLNHRPALSQLPLFTKPELSSSTLCTGSRVTLYIARIANLPLFLHR
ncbi:hypothetical protein QQF64_035584 [Cirrhinus molitorella]|uniref:Uncharacterized protein n=1 Tax=Cirrhinus molitorella TaxID=172907 RepID=A0ABR3NGX0_9TELE